MQRLEAEDRLPNKVIMRNSYLFLFLKVTIKWILIIVSNTSPKGNPFRL